MNDTSKIFVVAPDPEFRHSIAFALGAEGFAVREFEELSDMLEPALAICLIIDEKAVEKFGNDWLVLDGIDAPKVLLTAGLRAIPPVNGMTVLFKPLLGRQLIDAVSGAIERQRQMFLRGNT